MERDFYDLTSICIASAARAAKYEMGYTFNSLHFSVERKKERKKEGKKERKRESDHGFLQN